MAETTPGGRYLRPDGKTYVNAAGEPVAAPERARASREAKPKEPQGQPAPVVVANTAKPGATQPDPDQA